MNPYDKNLFITSVYIVTNNDKCFANSVRLGHSDTGKLVVNHGNAEKVLILDILPGVNNRLLKKARSCGRGGKKTSGGVFFSQPYCWQDLHFSISVFLCSLSKFCLLMCCNLAFELPVSLLIESVT